MPHHRHSRSLAAVVAAAVLTAGLAACGSQQAAAGGGGAQHSRITSSPPATGSPAAKQARLLSTGQQGSKAQVPWSAVGPGWLLATWTPPIPAADQVKTASGGVRSSKPQPTTLYLVDPAGGRYTVASWSASAGQNAQPYVLAWSGDGQRALLGYDTSRVTVLNLRSGTSDSFTPASGVRLDGFTTPDGLALVADAGTDTTHPHLERLSLTGALQQSWPASFRPGDWYTGGPVYTATGTELAVGTTAGVELVSNTGRPIRSLPAPASRSHCTPLRWWTASELLASCIPSTTSISQLWMFPASGAAPAALTASPAAPGDDGDLNAWSLPGGTYVQDAGGCGYQYLAKLGPGGRTSPVTVPGVPSGESTIVLGAHGSDLAIEAVGACSGGPSLLWFTPAGNAVTPLLGGQAADGGSAFGVLFGTPGLGAGS